MPPLEDARLAVIVVPCYNEAARLDVAAFRDAPRREATDIHFLFVDDGSTDGTATLVRSLVAHDAARCSLLQLPRNFGKAEAVRAGLQHALGRAPAFVGYLDADLSTPIEGLLALLDTLAAREELHWVMGSRVRMLGYDVRRNTARHYVGRLFATAASVTLGIGVYDTQCGAKVMRASPLLSRSLEEPFGSRWAFDVELLARIRAYGGFDAAGLEAVIHEQPLRRWHDVDGSKVRPFDFVRSLAELARVRRRYFGARNA